MKLAGKTAIVTGAGRDIGRACALKLADEGANIVLSYFESSKGAQSTVDEIKKRGSDAIAVQADLRTQDGVDSLVKSTLDQFGAIDVLVNNSGGIIARKKIADMSLDHWHAVMDINLTSTFLMLKACLPHMTSGAIVNVASQAGRDGGGPGAAAYAASKGAIMSLTRGLAKELGPDIRVNAVCPGMIDTGFHTINTPDAARKAFEAAAPLKRQGLSEDVANLVLFLACSDSAFITGTNVDINGGVLFS